ncbi:hypothetical protein OIV83_000474 [Microbotryomycetes sp. JL201]|nr:hypothetical protein OIV83_000474 [Microbotryomycetes sp. JL201]
MAATSSNGVVYKEQATVPAAAVARTRSSSARQPLSFWPSLLIVLPVIVALGWLSAHLHYSLPEPGTELFSANGSQAVFSEHQALKYINDLAVHSDGSPRYRIVGTEEMVITEKYIIDQVERIRREVVAKMGDFHQIEVWHQVGSGEHLFDFMDKKVWKKYINIGNVIVRLSDGTAASKHNAVLVNAHTDSTLPSPGAADDLLGVGVMLETLRVMGMTRRRLTNSVIFLFNGAEESLQDASHMFITQHPLKDSVRAVINLEACGVAGPEIVFQATSEEMIRALAKTPRPYATVLASEIFSTGLILSDTDFRQFAEYGNLTGLDMAIVQNSYLYHTRLDLPEFIEPGATQHMGENVIALLEYLTSPATALGNSLTAEKLPKSPTSSVVFFSGLGGKLFVVLTRDQATFAYGILAALAAVVVADRVDWSQKRLYIAMTLNVGTSLVAAILGANIAAFVTAIIMKKTMTWFRNEAFPILVFGPPAILSVLLVQRRVAKRLRTPRASYAVEVADVGIGSTYLLGLGVVSILTTIIFNDYILRPGKGSVHLASYLVGMIVPMLLGVEGLVGFLDLFVPLTGRLGADAPVDFIIATLTSAVGFLCVPMIVPFSHRFGPKVTSRLALFLTFWTAGTLGWFTRPSWQPYDKMHPKRLLVLHMENTTTTPPHYNLHVASVDGAPFEDLVVAATKGLTLADEIPTPARADDYTTDWDVIFPTYKVPLPPAPATYTSPFQGSFTVKAVKSVLNSIKRTRTLEIEMKHPGIMWPVVAFDADVISWDLPKPPARGFIRHHVKSVAAFGVDVFKLSVVVELTPEQFEATMRENQRDKGQRNDVSAKDRRLGRIRIDFSGLDATGMYPASMRHADIKSKPGMQFFDRFEKRLPQEVDSMLLSAIAGVAYGLPRNDAPPSMPRMQRGLPRKRKIPGVKHIVVVSSGKGGVGKSSVSGQLVLDTVARGYLPRDIMNANLHLFPVYSVNLALALSRLTAAHSSRLRVGLLDLDIFGPSVPKLMGLEGMGEPELTKDNRLTPLRSHGVPCMSMGFLLSNSKDSTQGEDNSDTPVVWRGMMVMKAVQQLLFDVDWRAGSGGHNLDVLVIDTPPGTGDISLSLGQLVEVDGSVIVSTPQNVAIIDTRKGVAMFRKLGIPIFGSVLNMSYFKCPESPTKHYIFGKPATFNDVCAKLGLQVLAEIPIEPDVSANGDSGVPIVVTSTSTESDYSDGGDSRRDIAGRGLDETKRDRASTVHGGLEEDSNRPTPERAIPPESTEDSATQAFHRLAATVWHKLAQP